MIGRHRVPFGEGGDAASKKNGVGPRLDLDEDGDGARLQTTDDGGGVRGPVDWLLTGTGRSSGLKSMAV